jgi:hypothetical protein
MGPDLERLKWGPTARLHAASVAPGYTTHAGHAPERTVIPTGSNAAENAKPFKAAIYTSKGPFSTMGACLTTHAPAAEVTPMRIKNTIERDSKFRLTVYSTITPDSYLRATRS